ncbi:hypothetical protein GCM10011414_04550 [Croceivirga lutea]|uniref:VOC family protein n=1 Tax=Croceivirga lutea TaxID=1775167 RepID=UPI00163988E6|nr:VOC family protein [Croceivirga lutea]GGG38309.1 hypothetical protein GCM10011414_04550 [Croceivirga lutea]
MRIAHIAIWVQDLEKSKSFYERYFNGKSNALYYNPKKNFKSYFISFADGAQLELMHKPEIPVLEAKEIEHTGLTHFAISVGSKKKVDMLTNQIIQEGFTVVGEPRTTGDGFYESVILDPEGNRIEITI